MTGRDLAADESCSAANAFPRPPPPLRHCRGSSTHHHAILSSTQPQRAWPGACSRLAPSSGLQARCTAPRGGDHLFSFPCKRAGRHPQKPLALSIAMALINALLAQFVMLQGAARALQAAGGADLAFLGKGGEQRRPAGGERLRLRGHCQVLSQVRRVPTLEALFSSLPPAPGQGRPAGQAG